VELLTNHRSEGSIIFENAHKISKGEMPTFDGQSFRLLTPSAKDAKEAETAEAEWLPKVGKNYQVLKTKVDQISRRQFATSRMSQDKMDTYLR
jgi:hypothetical protein